VIQDVARANKRAREYEETLVEEGWEPGAARSRALAAYGLCNDPAPVELRMSRCWRKERLEEEASRHPHFDGERSSTEKERLQVREKRKALKEKKP
jgi:hypothetical protein